MYILIGGGGQVGYYLTKGLLRQGHEVVLLEKDTHRTAQLAEELDSAVGRGDACEARVLEEYGCGRADMVIAVTGDDEDNLVICQMAKARFNVNFTIARVNNPRNDSLFRRLGIDLTISPTQSILHMIEAQLPHHTLVPLLTLTRAGLGLVELTVPPDSRGAGQAIHALNLPQSVNIALIVRGEQNITPTGDTIIEPEDHIFALVTAEGERVLRETVLNEVVTPAS
ncbi:MAG: TrkA family potassium uptake protein [Ktedonobacterales bacterium]|nr:TrkA family potassium uptake protein [Ktedonobacterales bacterium]